MKVTPQHIAIIMDGNGRWAQQRKMPRVAGHHRGVESARVVVQYCVDKKIPILTLFAFSSENWRRPATEVKLLMSLLQKLLLEEAHQLHSNNVKLKVIGAVQDLAPALQTSIEQAENITQHNTGLQLNIALNYGGRWDIVQAAQAIAADVVAGKLSPEQINETNFNSYICLGDLFEPDLLIRTSGEQRISNFLLWQIAYSEIFFSPTLWPDFGALDLDAALESFADRERRFGLVAKVLQQEENV